LLCINSIVVRAQKEKLPNLVNEFAATLDSLPNKKNLATSRDKASKLIMEVQFMTPYSLTDN
jgi:hypothetical protein